jgi:hypothetical protein
MSAEAVLGVGNIGFCLGPRAFRGLAQKYTCRYNRNYSRKGKNFNFRILKKRSIIKLTEILEFHFITKTVFFYPNTDVTIFEVAKWRSRERSQTFLLTFVLWKIFRQDGIMVRKYRVIRALYYTNLYKRGLASPRLPRASHNLKPPLVVTIRLHPLYSRERRPWYPQDRR